MASEPAVVVMRSCVSMLSLMSTGMPCSGPRGPFAFRSLSRSLAIDSTSGFSSITELIAGPCLSISSMRSRYFFASECAVYFPDAIPACNSPTVSSSSSNAAGGGALKGELPSAVDISFAATRLTVARPIPPAMP